MRRAGSLALFVFCTFLASSSSLAGAQVPNVAAPQQQPAPESPEVQNDSVRTLQPKVWELFKNGQYAQIDALAQQLRSQKTRFRGGNWELNYLYQVINTPGSVTATDAEWQALIDKLQSWIASNPKSPTPRIALAEAYIGFGERDARRWRFRI